MDEGGSCESGGVVGSPNESPDPKSQDPYPGRDHARLVPGQEGSPSDGCGCDHSSSGTASETDAKACDNVNIGGLVPSEHDTSPHARPCHYYVDVPHAEESTYDVHERNVPIDPEFHVDLEEQSNDFSQFLALPEVIPARKRKKQQPLLDFSKSRILMSVAYTQACEEVLAQKIAREAEARRKVAEKEANWETRLREKQDQQRQVA